MGQGVRKSLASSLRSMTSSSFMVLAAVVFVAIFGVYIAWSINSQRDASEQKVLEEARLLSTQMNAAWNYIDAMQDSINYNSDGTYDFKNVYCSVAGKSIARNFTNKTGCIIRYTRENPRTGSDAPDEFELAALRSFEQGGTEYYGVSVYEGRSVFRYLSALPMKYGCLTCHGEPAGEIDETGYPKEGYQLGDLAGAISLIIPMDEYHEEATNRTWANIGLFAALAFIATTCAGVTSFELMRQRREVEEANDRLEKANEALIKESEYKSTFLATMTHELRAPLASMIALTEVWDKASSKDAEMCTGIPEEIRRNSKKLLATIDNTLDAASLEANRYAVNLAPLDMIDEVNDIERVIAPMASEKEIDFSIEMSSDFPLVVSDQGIIHKILMNLLSNAVKFTDKGGAVHLSLALNRELSEILIKVADSGIGIPESDFAVIFERFRQSDSSISRRYGGSGLGLSLVKELSELLGGSTCVKSEVGRGSTFEVVIPCRILDESELGDEDIDG